MKSKFSVLQPTAQHINNIPIDRIKESIITLRTEYNKKKLEELGDSMKDRGQLQTIVVQPDEKDPGYYELIVGSRRLRAVRLKGRRYIAAYVIEKRDPVELLLIALTENLHRDDLNPFEEARAFLRLTKEHNLEPSEIAERINKPLTFIISRLKLLAMPDEVVKMIADRQLPMNALQSLARLPTGDEQVRYARLMIRHHLTQAELSAQVQQELNEPAKLGSNTYEFTSVKFIARLTQIDRFLVRVPRRIRIERLNSTEKTKIKNAIEKLEMDLELLKNQLELTSNIMVSRSVSPVADSKSTENKGQEWTVADIQRITSANRPSDEVLASELGRTISSIRAMRAKTSRD